MMKPCLSESEHVVNMPAPGARTLRNSPEKNVVHALNSRLSTPRFKTGPHRRPHARRRGLTLIEILVVVTILGMIASIVGIMVSGQLQDAQVDTTKVQLKNLEEALQLYKIKLNRFPTTAEGLQALTRPPQGRRPFMEVVPKDAWSQDFNYVSPGAQNPGKFDLQSKGADGVADTEDDIKNWE